ncbi:MAG: type I-C CRISPR-associated protein Cas5c [Candidatus Krumholzibacteriia bacterium]
MAYGIKLLVWGEFACFTRPEMKVERVSYDIITPSAARGLLEAIYWKPQMRWMIDRIHVINPVRKTHVRRNEISSVISVKGASGVAAAMKTGKGNLGIAVDQDRQQRSATILCDVRYGIEAHVEIVGDEEEGPAVAKHLEMFKRRASGGQYFQHPYLGNREFPAEFALVEKFPDSAYSTVPQQDLGLMLHDVEFLPDPDGRIVRSNDWKRVKAIPRFFSAVMISGVVEVPELSSREGKP